MKVELHIDELILEGIPNFQREQVAVAIERALTALVAEHGVPPGWQQSGALAGLTQQVQSGSRPEAIGRQVAQAILSNVNTASQSAQVVGTNSPGVSVQSRSIR
jgi:hypothetical protein